MMSDNSTGSFDIKFTHINLLYKHAYNYFTRDILDLR